MMNETLQKELSAHFKKIDDRKEQLDKIEKSLNLQNTSFQSFEQEIEAEVTKKIKEYLDKNNFDYEKGRNRFGDRIIFEGGYIKIREFKKQRFFNLDVLNSDKLNEFLPNGLIEARNIIVEKLKQIEEVILEFKGKTKLKKAVTIQYVGDNKIKEEKIKEIEISFNCEEEHSYSGRHNRYSYSSENHSYKTRNEKFEIKLNDYTHKVDDALYSDEVFNNILSLIEKFKKHIQEIKKKKEKMKEGLKHLVFNQINKIIILGELKE